MAWNAPVRLPTREYRFAGLDRADEQLGGRAPPHLAPRAGAGGQQLAVGRERHGPDVAALARAGKVLSSECPSRWA